MKTTKKAIALLLMCTFVLLVPANGYAKESYLINIWNTKKVVSGQTFTSDTFTPKTNHIQLYCSISDAWRSDSITIKLQEYITGKWYTVYSDTINGYEGLNLSKRVDEGEKYRVLITYIGKTMIREELKLQVFESVD